MKMTKLLKAALAAICCAALFALSGCVTSQRTERVEANKKTIHDAWQFRVLGYPVIRYSCETKIGE
jgi:uncharacterized lipoprotein YehR (DUF1307 family)